MNNLALFPCTKTLTRGDDTRNFHTPVFSRQSFSSDSMGSDNGITSREGWCTTDAVNRKGMSVL